MDAAPFDETIKWTNLVFMANGPCILIRAEEARVLLGFWRGKRLRDLDPRIKASGKYELGNLVLTETTDVTAAEVARLAAAAHRPRTDVRRGGKAWVRTCRSRRSQYH